MTFPPEEKANDKKNENTVRRAFNYITILIRADGESVETNMCIQYGEISYNQLGQLTCCGLNPTLDL
jgi:hypothetical protein